MTERAFPQASLTSERLMLRPFRVDVHTVWNDDVYLRFAPAGLATAGLTCDGPSSAPIFAVERRADGRLVGHIALFGTDWTRMVTEIHYWTAPWGRGNGYAAESVRPSPDGRRVRRAWPASP